MLKAESGVAESINGTITAGTNITITGSGTTASPYNIGVSPLPTIPNYLYTTGGTQYYLGILPGQTTTSTNSTASSNNVMYACAAIAQTSFTMKAVQIRTGATNASSGADVLVGVYDSTGSGSTPGNLLGSVAGQLITNAAESTTFTWTFTGTLPVIPAGIFYIALLQGNASTGVEWTTLATSVPQSIYLGGGSGILAGSNITWGYSVSATYSNGAPSPFGTAAQVTSSGNAFAATYLVN